VDFKVPSNPERLPASVTDFEGFTFKAAIYFCRPLKIGSLGNNYELSFITTGLNLRIITNLELSFDPP
jgi:hypothetical protein